MINFNKEIMWNLKPVGVSDFCSEVSGLLVQNEEVIAAFMTAGEQIVFTSKRIVIIEMQGGPGKRNSFTSLPYSKVQFFTIQSLGFREMHSDSALDIVFNNGYTVRFEFGGDVDIGRIGRIISDYVLG